MAEVYTFVWKGNWIQFSDLFIPVQNVLYQAIETICNTSVSTIDIRYILTGFARWNNTVFR
jgi:hypothetical protein